MPGVLVAAVVLYGRNFVPSRGATLPDIHRGFAILPSSRQWHGSRSGSPGPKPVGLSPHDFHLPLLLHLHFLSLEERPARRDPTTDRTTEISLSTSLFSLHEPAPLLSLSPSRKSQDGRPERRADGSESESNPMLFLFQVKTRGGARESLNGLARARIVVPPPSLPPSPPWASRPVSATD